MESDNTNNIPEDIKGIIKLVAQSTAGYDNHLKWNEEAKLKSDMMKHKAQWKLASPDEVFDYCIECGMMAEDSGKIKEMLEKVHANRRLIPHRSYRNFEFKHEHESEDIDASLPQFNTSSDW